MISPSDGTRAIHCCAAMLGLQLEKELPNNVLLVHGMRKTSDLTLGRSYLEEAFKSFGDIEGAAIAPSNRGFGKWFVMKCSITYVVNLLADLLTKCTSCVPTIRFRALCQSEISAACTGEI